MSGFGGVKRKHDADSSFQKLVENARKKRKTVDDIPKYYMRLNELQEIYKNALEKAKEDFIEEYGKGKKPTEKKKIVQKFENEIKIKAMEKANKIKKTTEKEGYTKPDYEELNNASIYIADTKVYDEQPFSEHVDTPEGLFRFVEFFQVLQREFENDMDFAESEEGGLTIDGGKKKSKSNQKKKSKRKQKTKHRRKSTRKSRRKPRSHKK